MKRQIEKLKANVMYPTGKEELDCLLELAEQNEALAKRVLELEERLGSFKHSGNVAGNLQYLQDQLDRIKTDDEFIYFDLKDGSTYGIKIALKSASAPQENKKVAEQNQDLSKRVSELEEKIDAIRLVTKYSKELDNIDALESANHPSMPKCTEIRHCFKTQQSGLQHDACECGFLQSTKETSMPKAPLHDCICKPIIKVNRDSSIDRFGHELVDNCPVHGNATGDQHGANIDLSFAIKALKHCLNHNSYGSCIIVTDKKPDQDSLRLAIYLLENQQAALENSKHNNEKNK